MFEGFPQEMIAFFLDLRFHNSKEFMDKNRDRYLHKVREPFYDFINEIGPKMLRIDEDFEIRPHKCLSRINRDVRFSKDKSPYRDHLWLSFKKSGAEKDGAVFYWLEISPEYVQWGLGIWGENRNLLDTMRRRMEADPESYEDLFPCLKKAGFEMSGQNWKKITVPENIPEELKDLYVKRSLYFSKKNPRFDWIYEKNLPDRIYKDFRYMAPVYRMLMGCFSREEA